MSQAKYSSKKQIQKSLEEGLSKLENKNDFAGLKALLTQESKNIAPAVVKPRADLQSMKTTLVEISTHIDNENYDHVKFYNDLVTETNVCHQLPINVVDRFVPYDVATKNVTYICEFSEFLGYVNTHIDEFFH
jgi:hypothetical protein